jgi:hypothetical protein
MEKTMSNTYTTPESVTEIPAPTVPGTKKLTPLKAIRLKCLDCSGDSKKEVELCPVENCPQWPFRFGTNPFRKKPKLTDEQKQELTDRLTRKEALQTTPPSDIIQ